MTADLFYRIRYDPSSFALEHVAPKEQGVVARRECSPLELVRRICESGDTLEEQTKRFYLACLVLIAGEHEQRRTVQRLRPARTRNIKTRTKSCAGYLNANISLLDYAERANPSMELQKMNDHLAESLQAIKQELGLSVAKQMDTRYHLTEPMYVEFEDEGFKQEIERFITSVGIPTENKDGTLLYNDDLKLLTNRVAAEYPKQWKKLAKAIAATESREHLSALSLTTGKVPGSMYISLANTHGDLLTMEAWKFVAILENTDSPRKLADLVELKRQEPDSLFAFNLHREGEIFARLDVSESTLQVVCRSTKDNQISGRANFVIDLNYSLCVFIALKRLREDQERFTRLKEEANSIICPEVFENLFH